MKDIKFQNNIKLKSWLQFLSSAAAVVLIASAGSLLRFRLDLTEDKRYTLSGPTRKVLSSVKKDIYIQVWLDGEMPVPLKKLRRTAGEMLDEFRIASGRKIDYEFINPSGSKDAKKRQSEYQSLINKGLTPINIQAGDAEGGSTRKIIFPGMLINCNGVEVPVNFLKNNPNLSYEQNILHSEEGLEYELIQNIATLSSDTVYKVAFIEGHGELPEIETADLTLNLAKFFTVDRGVIGGKPGILDHYAAVIIAGPEKEFSESDKLVLDQYIMNGGKAMWLFDEVKVDVDSLTFGETVGLYRTLNIEDQIFMYGARVNPAIVQDLGCQIIRLKVGTGGTNQQIVPAPWVYYPLLIPSATNPVTRNLNRVLGQFANYIDTVGLDTAVKKTILLSTSKFSRTVSPPLMISLKEAELTPDEKTYDKSGLPVAVLLEGVFPSAFRNRGISTLTSDKNLKIRTESKKTRQIIIADADIIRNEVKRVGLEVNPLPLGQDKYTGQMYGNRDFLINCLNYLVDDRGLMELRSREVKLRLLDKMKVKSEKMMWQLINVIGPVLIVMLAGLLYNYFRRRKFTRI
jgi:gliding-associated putative ABC transporter substrate-binding component GldG